MVHGIRPLGFSERFVADFQAKTHVSKGQSPQVWCGGSQKSHNPGHAEFVFSYIREHDECTLLCIGCILLSSQIRHHSLFIQYSVWRQVQSLLQN